MTRRDWIADSITTGLLALAGCGLALPGCSSGGKKSGGGKTSKKSGSHSPISRSKRPKGPKTMGNLLLDSYIDDLKSSSAQTKIYAAQELGNMGSGAKKAIPALESLQGDPDAKVSAAATQAIKSIKK